METIIKVYVLVLLDNLTLEQILPLEEEVTDDDDD